MPRTLSWLITVKTEDNLGPKIRDGESTPEASHTPEPGQALRVAGRDPGVPQAGQSARGAPTSTCPDGCLEGSGRGVEFRGDFYSFYPEN